MNLFVFLFGSQKSNTRNSFYKVYNIEVTAKIESKI